jgi:O-acetyl-ADP-ribose deacetylase (regulator of RNase III)
MPVGKCKDSASRTKTTIGGLMKKRTYEIGQSTLTLEFGDLTTSNAEVLVSSDDSYVTMGGGVSAAILRAGGDAIMIDAAKKVPARLGDVVVTSAGSLQARHIFHAITISDEKLEPKEVISRATRRCLELLVSLDLRSIAFPAIGAGVAGFSYEDVAVRMAEVMVEFLGSSQRPIDATIYLYDRFGMMQPIDYVSFFEEFATRATGLVPVTRDVSKRNERGSGGGGHTRTKSTKQERRKKLLHQLVELDRERQLLETRLAEFEGALSKTEIRKVERQLKEVHQKRVEVLSEVKPTRGSRSVSVFVSYSHADEKLRKDLGKHLSVLERQGLISTWHDRMIAAGTEWEGIIDRRLEDSRVILLLVSADFIDSKYCYDVEMKRALERHEKREALVIPVMLRPVALKGTPFAKIQSLPKDARPVTDWPNLDSAFVDITEGLRNALQDLATGPPSKASRPTAAATRMTRRG